MSGSNHVKDNEGMSEEHFNHKALYDNKKEKRNDQNTFKSVNKGGNRLKYLN